MVADLGLRPEAEALIARHNSGEPRAVFVKTDVTVWADLNGMFETALSEFGSFDIVCPGAGVYEPHWSNFWHPPGSPESKDDINGNSYASLDINLTHPIRATQLAMQYWLHPQKPTSPAGAAPSKASIENPKRVVLISSIAAQIPVFRSPIYGAAKHAISGFARCLAELEPAQGIRVNAVAPGLVRTPLWTDHPEKLVNVNEESDGWITPEAVAGVMLSCLESPALVGGSVVEVGKGTTRTVTAYNDPGPDFTIGAGIVSSKSSAGNQMVWDWLADEKMWRVYE